MGSVLTFGETMGLVRGIDLGGWETVSTAHVGIGGADSNVAIGLRRLGIRSSWIGRVGNDAIGRRIEREIRAEGVLTRAIIDPHRPTGVMLKERRTSIHSRVSFYRHHSAGSVLAPGDVRDEDIAASTLVLVNGVTASLSATARDAVLSVARRARANNVPVAFDVNHRASLWADADPRPLYLEIAGLSDVVFAGEDEARLLLGTDAASSAELAQGIAALGRGHAVLKGGAAGALAYEGGRSTSALAMSIDPVDTVGAGDAFVAGYLAGMIEDASVTDRLAMAVRCGAFACLNPGDWEGSPRRADLALFDGVDPVER